MVGDALVVLTAIGLGSLLKGITGLGLPLIAIPFMATFLGVERAVVVMAIPTVVTNIVLLYDNRQARPEANAVAPLVWTGVAGAVIGTALLTSVDEQILSFTLASLIAAFLLITALRPTFHVSTSVMRYASPPIGLAAGLLHGSMGTSGVVLATYLHGFRMTRDAYVYSITMLFQAFATVQVCSLLALGRYDLELFVLSVAALPGALALLGTGMQLGRHLRVEVFQRLVLAMLAAAALKLAIDGITAT